jgi:acyl dehydratase
VKAAVGDALTVLEVAPIRREAMAEMAVILADPNPIHLDAVVVASLGLGDREIVQGPIGVGFLLNLLAGALPAATLEKLQVRFLANVFAGDRLQAGGQVAGVEDVDGAQRLTCSVWLDVVGGSRVLEGTATLRI